MANILYIAQYFGMESESADLAQRYVKHAQALAGDGHSVTVLTTWDEGPNRNEKPKHPISDPSLQSGLRVIRISGSIQNPQNTFIRVLGELRFAWQALSTGLSLQFCEKQRFGFVLASSTPFIIALVAYALALCHRADLYVDVNRLGKQALPATGSRSNPLLRTVGQAMQTWLYRKARRIIVSSPALRDALEKQIPTMRHKIECIPNGAELDYYQYPQLCKESYLRTTWDDQSLFHVNYTGGFNDDTKPEVLLAVAAVMQERHPDIRFNFSGSGQHFERIRRRAEDYELSNIKFWDAFPKKKMSKFLMEGDLSILHYRNLPDYAPMLPAMLFDCLAAGRPVLAAVPDGEASRVLRQSKAGMTVPPENVMAIVEAISWFYEHPKQGLKMGVQAYNFVARNFDHRQLVNRLLALFPRGISQHGAAHRDDGMLSTIRIANRP